jgi:radical SAM-linked protein
MINTSDPLTFPILIRFEKAGLMRFIGHLDWQALQQAMFLRAGFKIKVGAGPTRKLKLKTSPPTPVGVSSRCEYTYLVLDEHLYPDEARRRLSMHCPDGVEVLEVKDAAHLAKKNPFGVIEATSYGIEFGDGLTGSHIEGIASTLNMIRSDDPPDGTEPDKVKGFWGRIIELDNSNSVMNLFAVQREGETFHAAKCASFLEEQLDLPHYPIFTKLDYYRLKPSKRALFR